MSAMMGCGIHALDPVTATLMPRHLQERRACAALVFLEHVLRDPGCAVAFACLIL
jgi:hypothetical protein